QLALDTFDKSELGLFLGYKGLDRKVFFVENYRTGETKPYKHVIIHNEVYLGANPSEEILQRAEASYPLKSLDISGLPNSSQTDEAQTETLNVEVSSEYTGSETSESDDDEEDDTDDNFDLAYA
ncbi:hypothetical protein HDU98_004670, partial [Podochytrium sp. JEL0797]